MSRQRKYDAATDTWGRHGRAHQLSGAQVVGYGYGRQYRKPMPTQNQATLDAQCIGFCGDTQADIHSGRCLLYQGANAVGGTGQHKRFACEIAQVHWALG